VPGADKPQPNPDLEALAAAVRQAAQKPQESPRKFSVRELLYETYELSCIDMKSCVQILGMLGYTTTPPSGEVDIGQLPAAFEMPFEAGSPTVGRSELKAEKAALTDETLSAPQHRLMILYHSSQTEEVGKLKDLLVETIDVPDRQVLIEGMIIELTEDDLKELGAEWELFGKDWLKISFLGDGDKVPFILSYDPEFTPAAALADRVRTTIRMVIQEGKAEILSSPSVLVLNNRNARIKVVRETPIIKTSITRDIQSVDVRFEQVGIVLNIKPRISHDDSSVTMQIIAEVSEIPEGETIIVQGTEVAPVIDRRIVETIARVHNNTPFIIGGLIRNEKTRTMDRIPILSRIPILGVLFRKSVTTREKREVIIVLTPRVITPAGTQRPVLPKDADRFDFLNNRLFRNTYRVK
ncbi:MAG: type II secretion system protein GspD, partial [Candidatus Brocadiae bacterium]|nr:type II secretion system protein GspD [Candidatus Brocadiia bacterium]